MSTEPTTSPPTDLAERITRLQGRLADYLARAAETGDLMGLTAGQELRTLLGVVRDHQQRDVDLLDAAQHDEAERIITLVERTLGSLGTPRRR